MENSFLESLKGFSKLNHLERLNKLKELSFLSSEDISYLKSGGIPKIDLAEDLIENVLGYFNLPLGVAVNFIIDKEPYVIPLAVEETSIIAAGSKTARWVCQNGSIETETVSCLSIGQIQISKVSDFKHLDLTIKEKFPLWKEEVEEGVLRSMVKRGGGLKSYELRSLKRPGEDGLMAVLHLHIETCDAMGANLINQVCEYLKPLIEKETNEQVSLCILSNLADRRITKARVILKNQSADLIKKIEEASLFAEIDPYRAATHNKGILNSIDALLIATGNDWRAVEAGFHAYAARSGQYSSLSKWQSKGTELHGVLEAPFMLGTKGGVTGIHPTAQLSLKLLKFPSAERLAQICCALGLIQNLGALRALVTTGVIEGHMKLHMKNIALQTGANSKEKHILEERLKHIFKKQKKVSLTDALKILQDWRKEKRV